MTPAETLAVLDAAVWREELAFKRDIRLAWHVAALQRSRKRLPSLKTLLNPPGKTKTLTGDELEKRRQEHAELAERSRYGRRG